MQKRSRIMGIIICICVLMVSVTGCHKNENPTEIAQDIKNTKFIVSSESDQYSYHGARLTDNSAPCVFKIDYGCSNGEHQSLVAGFNKKGEEIV